MGRHQMLRAVALFALLCSACAQDGRRGGFEGAVDGEIAVDSSNRAGNSESLELGESGHHEVMDLGDAPSATTAAAAATAADAAVGVTAAASALKTAAHGKAAYPPKVKEGQLARYLPSFITKAQERLKVFTGLPYDYDSQTTSEPKRAACYAIAECDMTIANWQSDSNSEQDQKIESKCEAGDKVVTKAGSVLFWPGYPAITHTQLCKLYGSVATYNTIKAQLAAQIPNNVNVTDGTKLKKFVGIEAKCTKDCTIGSLKLMVGLKIMCCGSKKDGTTDLMQCKSSSSCNYGNPNENLPWFKDDNDHCMAL